MKFNILLVPSKMIVVADINVLQYSSLFTLFKLQIWIWNRLKSQQNVNIQITQCLVKKKKMQKQFFWIWNFSKKIFKMSILQLELNYACHKKSYCAHFRTRERMIKLQDHNILETSMIVINPRSLKIWRNVSFNYTSEY